MHWLFMKFNVTGIFFFFSVKHLILTETHTHAHSIVGHHSKQNSSTVQKNLKSSKKKKKKIRSCGVFVLQWNETHFPQRQVSSARDEKSTDKKTGAAASHEIKKEKDRLPH